MSDPTLSDVMTELRDLRVDVAALREALRASRVKATRRTVAVRGKVAARSAAEHMPSELEIAAAARVLAKRGRRAK